MATISQITLSGVLAVVLIAVVASQRVQQEGGGAKGGQFMDKLSRLRQNRMNETQLKAKILEIHNDVRRQHSAPDVTLNEALSDAAKDEAEKKAAQWAAERKFQSTQDPDRSYNDNIWATESVSTTKIRPEKVLAPWLAEEKDYDYKTNYFKEATGHFSQMIWKSTDEIGVGWAMNRTNANLGPRKYIYIVVVRYTPPGNILDTDAFSENISPPSGGQAGGYAGDRK